MSRRKNRIFYELRFRVNIHKTGVIEILKSILTSLGVKEEETVELVCGNCAYLSVYFTSPSKVKALGRRLKKLRVRHVTIEIRSLKERSWRELWKTDFKPFPIGGTFVVVPPWLKKKYSPRSRRPLYLDTSLAFGSGLHETTRFMVQLIERCEGRFADFLDIGTGSGILSVAASHCAAGRIRAIDFDPDAVKIAKANLRENGIRRISGVMTADIHHDKIPGKYDLVVANLVTHNLIKAGRRIVSLVQPGKYMAVSGISLENLKKFRTAYQKYPLRCLKVIKGKDWAALLYKKLPVSAK